MRNTLICTVGTSLFGNIKRTEELKNASIKEAFEAKNWQRLSLLLLERSNLEFLCGAEINSIASICNHNLLERLDRLIFLVSATDTGRNQAETNTIAEHLKNEYSQKS